MPSLPEAVDLKYGDECPDAQVTEVACVALTLKRSGRQRLPSVLILSECDIEKAGDEEEVERKCEGVRELDLSRNKLKEWSEVWLSASYGLGRELYQGSLTSGTLSFYLSMEKFFFFMDIFTNTWLGRVVPLSYS